MKRLINWIAGLFKDERGVPSSKRFVGIIAGLSLCVVFFISSLTCGKDEPSTALIDTIALLAFSCLGLASVDKIWGKRDSNNNNNAG